MVAKVHTHRFRLFWLHYSSDTGIMKKASERKSHSLKMCLKLMAESRKTTQYRDCCQAEAYSEAQSSDLIIKNICQSLLTYLSEELIMFFVYFFVFY
jgi:hypothetical protein